MAKDLKVTVTVNLIPHSDPKSAINLVAEIVTKQLVCEKVG